MRRFAGLKVMFAGLCIGLLSMGCSFVFDSKVFLLGFIAGWCICAVGFVVHFYLMFKHKMWRS